MWDNIHLAFFNRSSLVLPFSCNYRLWKFSRVKALSLTDYWEKNSKAFVVCVKKQPTTTKTASLPRSVQHAALVQFPAHRGDIFLSPGLDGSIVCPRLESPWIMKFYECCSPRKDLTELLFAFIKGEILWRLWPSGRLWCDYRHHDAWRTAWSFLLLSGKHYLVQPEISLQW